MRLRDILSAVLCASLLPAGPASASSFAHGLQFASHGACVVTAPPDEQSLHCAEIGSSGSDGADISLLRADGHSLSCPLVWSSSDVGASCSFSWGMSQSGTPPGSSGSTSVQLVRSQGGMTYSWSLASVPAGSSARLLLYLGNALVLSSTVGASGSLETSVPAPVITIDPQVAFELSREHQKEAASLEVPQCLFFAGGQAVQADRAVVVCDLDRDGALDFCAVRCSNPPGGDFTALDISSQGCTRSGHVEHTVGRIHYDELEISASGWRISNIGSQSSEGVSVSKSLFRSLCSDGTCSSFGAAQFEDIWPIDGDVDFEFASPSLTFQPSDDGASATYQVTGTGGCSPDGVLASLETRAHGEKSPQNYETLECVLSSHFSGICAAAESIVVSNQGVVVSRLAIPVDGSVVVTPPPGGPADMAISTKGAPATCTCETKSSTKKGQPELSKPRLPALASSIGPDGLALHVGFRDLRTFCVAGTCVDGDDIEFQASGVSRGAVITPTGSNFLFRSGSSSGSPSSVSVLDVKSSGIDQVFASVPPSSGLSTAHTTLEIPVRIARVDTTPMRGYSVTLHWSPNLALVGPVTEYDYLSRSGQTQMFTTNNPDGSLTVDCALLGPGCGPAGDGTLFSIQVATVVPPAAPSGSGDVTIDAVELADCNAGPIPSSAGGSAYIPFDFVPPPAITDLVASQVKTGNGSSGTTTVQLHATVTDPDVSLEVYRAAFGNYPEYGTGPSAGSVPQIPGSYPPPASWTRVVVSNCGASAPTVSNVCDAPPSRDFFYYVVAPRDRFGNLGAFSNMTSGTLSYHLGDVAGGGATCAGDNQVTTADISALGAHYGVTLSVGSSLECLDVGPTADGTVDGRPVADHRLSFADLILYAINYSLVSMPASTPRPLAASTDALRLRVPPLPGVGQTFDVALEMSGVGDVQGLSAQLTFDAAVVEAVGVAQGDLLAHQGRDGVVLSSQPGDVDAALLGVGAGIAGEGELARVTFRVKAPGDPGLGLGSVNARDSQNRTLAMGGVGVPGATPPHTALRMAFPNPFDRSTTVLLSLSQTGPASVRVFDVAGRTVRTLLHGMQPAGERVLAWDGRDDSGAPLNAGVYMLRLDTAGHSETRSVRLVK